MELSVQRHFLDAARASRPWFRVGGTALFGSGKIANSGRIFRMLHKVPTLLLSWLDIAGICVFAMSGALAAARARQTPLTFVFFAIVTGIGGNTLSDVLIGAPVAWVHDPVSIVICLVVAVLAWITPQPCWPNRAIDWFDALGIAAYRVVGSAKALSYGIPSLSAAIMGVFTACFGGVFRDVLAGEPSIIIRPELYVTAAALAAVTYVLLVALGVAPAIAAAVSFAMGFTLRALAIVNKIKLPSHHG